ncbi:hypothetical protein MFIFM68171_02141 [Madurella fahalii]|uniref:Kinesin light chain n=1 Tax=Madurella fahalii TaxID=1157608 RepID=A0ABQ0G2D5_9PEZI
MANMASAYSDQSRQKEVEALEVQVMVTRKRVLGEEHPDTLASIVNLTLLRRGTAALQNRNELNSGVLVRLAFLLLLGA